MDKPLIGFDLIMMLYSYILVRDYGFAPNPFYKFCTLATCKPDIRYIASVDDWVIGVGSNAKSSSVKGKLIYAMKITEKMSFDDYWNDKRFQVKIPIMNGSNKLFFGDNIYHKENNKWIQTNSHHSLPDGRTNRKNLKKDTSSEFVLVSTDFYYFGRELVNIPQEFKIVYSVKRKYISKKIPPKIRRKFISWIINEFEPGYYGDPIDFEDVDRFPGD